MSELNEEGGTQMTKFVSIMQDFTRDLLTSFPEYAETLDPRLEKVVNNNNDPENMQALLDYCKEVYPERFFDLLYKNDKLFENSDYNTHFLPNIEFKDVWRQNISDNTRDIIWKYLQLVCFVVVNGESDVETFGDTTKLFEAIGEKELKKKLGETISQMSDFLDVSGLASGTNLFDISENLPNPEELHEHINGLMNGKLGRLASDITEETMKDFTDISGISSVGDVFQNLFKNPGKLLKMVKRLGDSLDDKIKSGEIKESELMEEAAELMEKLKKVPGMKNMTNLFGKMGLDGLDGMLGGAGGGKLNFGAMQGQMNRNVRMAKQRDRMRAKLAARKTQQGTTKDQQISLLEKQLADAQKTNRLLESMQGENTEQSKKSKKKKRRKRRNKK